MQKIWLAAKPKGHRLPPALLFLYEPLPTSLRNDSGNLAVKKRKNEQPTHK
tara:strand:- start:1100 stop:1252 length:153 start_codon:yes stop_codon:yes gene_type:complete